MRSILYVLCISCIVACSKNNCDTSCEDCVDYNTPFQIEADNKYCFDDETTVTVLAINNEFCPCDVTCVWKGQMTIDLQWNFTDGSTISYQYQSSENAVNEPIPNDLKIISNDEDIVYEGTCPDISSPKILSALISVESR